MSDDELAEKKAYFKEQELLDVTDDETDFPDAGYVNIGHELDNSRPVPRPVSPPPSKNLSKQNSLLGPTPKERQAEFEEQSRQERARARHQTLTRSATAPETSILSETRQRTSPRSSAKGSKKNPRRASLLTEVATTSLSTSTSKNKSTSLSNSQDPFYMQAGSVPRELKNTKNAKPARNIKLVSANRQLLKDKLVYFFPNDDISMARRMRIHKVIQLGAAWVTKWRNDITYVMVDDESHTYAQLLKHLNMTSIPENVILVRFDPYIPQSMSFGGLQDPTANRFRVKGQPKPKEPVISAEPPPPSPEAQSSLQIKTSARRPETRRKERETTPPKEDLFSDLSDVDDIVKDSFNEPPTVQDGETSRADVKDRVSVHTSKEEHNDALAQAIEEAKATAHLPLDDEDDSEQSRPGTADAQDSDTGTDVESPKASSKLPKKSKYATTKSNSRASKKGLDLNAFQCMNPGNSKSSSENPNARTIEVLQEMCKYYDQMKDQWRCIAYRKAITTLKKQTTKVTTAQEAVRLPFIGQRLADKIEEIVLTNRLRKLDNTRDDPTDQVLRLFLGVYGAGLTQANKWMQAGHRTLDDLVANAKLTDSQRIGIEHYTDFSTRIPRAEVKAHGAIVRKALAKLDPNYTVTIMGSYRRGAQDTGDIDLIISRAPSSNDSNASSSSHSYAEMHHLVFDHLVPSLFKTNFLRAALATSSQHDPTGSKWHGASCLPSSTVWRRLDLLLVPQQEMGAALLYFTGNDIFNRSMRLLARKLGMRLNQKGLYKDVAGGRRGEKLNEGVLVEARSERRIFEMLGVPWREPGERIC